MGETSDFLRARYGHTRRRWPVVMAVVLALAGLGWLVWAVWGQSHREVTSALISFRTGSHTSTARIQIQLSDPGVRATCLVQAQALDHSVVGELHFRVPHDRGTRFTLTRTVRTERPPTAVVLIGCTAPGQQRPD
ncbi:MAG: DUF4307 domain-containing protein [Marmoricola sp.]